MEIFTQRTKFIWDFVLGLKTLGNASKTALKAVGTTAAFQHDCQDQRHTCGPKHEVENDSVYAWNHIHQLVILTAAWLKPESFAANII